jgi:IS5 family transposase
MLMASARSASMSKVSASEFSAKAARKNQSRRPRSAAASALPRRARVEHVFAGLAKMGGKGLPMIGLACATLQLNWKVAAYNLRRLVYLEEARIEAF